VSDQRLYPRYPVDVPGRILCNGAPVSDCRLQDLHLGGALIRFPSGEIPSHLKEGDLCDLDILLPGEAQKPVRVQARVAHLGRGSIGVLFHGARERAMVRIRGFIRSLADGQRRFAAEDVRVAPGALSPEHALSLLRGLAERRIDPMLDSLLEHLQNGLWSAAERAHSDQVRQDLQNDSVRLARAGLESQFQQQLYATLLRPLDRPDGSVRSDSLGPDSDTDLDSAMPTQLELVDKDRFEVWLANSSMVHRLEQACADPLRVLRLQVEALFGSNLSLALEPQPLADALQGILERLEISVSSQILCLRHATEYLSANLGAFYRELSSTWEEAGLLIEPAPVTPVVSPRGGSVTESLAPVEKEPADEGPESTEVVEGSGAAGFTLSADDLLDLLAEEGMPQGRGGKTERPASSLREGIDRLLALNRARGRRGYLDPLLAERIETTDRVLRQVSADSVASTEIKTLVESLSAPLLASALAVPTLFSEGGHPIARMLDQLEHIVALSPFCDHPEVRARQISEALVQRAIRTDVRDTAVWTQISEELEQLEGQLARRYQQQAERLVARYQGRELRRLAAARVNQRLNEAFAGRRIHKTVAALIREGWRSLLYLVYLRDGSESSRCQQYWSGLMELHIQTGGEVDHQDTERSALAPLLARVRDGLSYIGFDPFRLSQLLGRLEQAVRAHWADVAEETDYEVFAALPGDSEERAEAPAGEEFTTRDWEEALAQVNGLSPGSVLRMAREGQPVDLRFLWRSEDGTELLFAQPPGMTPRSFSRAAVARMLVDARAEAVPTEMKTVVARATESALQEMEERVRYQETHDILTGLQNRHRLIAALTEVLSQAPDRFEPQVLAFLEVDHLQAVSGTCGYTAGERMLLAVANLLERALQDARSVAYLGGARFGFLTPAEDEAQALAQGERIRTAMATLPFYWAGKSFPVSGSIGLMWVGATGDNPEQVLSAVESACMAAQRSGGNRALLFREDDESIVQQMDWMRWWIEAERIVKAERVRLRGQCIAQARTERLTPHHYEVLLSVFDEQGVPLPLEAFIRSAEAFNLAEDVDRLVVEKALAWAEAYPDVLRKIGGIAINLSGQSVTSAAMLEFLRTRIPSLRVPRELVSFEVTETSAIANLDQAVVVIEAIKALGCSFALDDFGSGNASFTYLKRLPVDYVKIDGSFIKDLMSNPHDQAIVKSMNEIAHFMGKETIAEYVENKEILERLREIGIDYVQGYGIEKPRFLDELG